MELRRLRYRLKRLGMLELEEWLARLGPALSSGDGLVFRAVQQLMDMETPQLVAMMHAEMPLPEVLRPWLEEKAG
jgi:succinate dehydrogenase flavin-adding protein (antitoxin of CptAB toxin-antitoxin module)